MNFERQFDHCQFGEDFDYAGEAAPGKRREKGTVTNAAEDDGRAGE